MNKPRLSFWQIFNMSFGFMGIQFGWGLQLANMSGIYTYLGASPDAVPLLWLAGPMTGLLVQPIIGSMSDRTWNRLGRRRPYFLVGAILASIALFFMPDSSVLWMAAGLLWILDASINISMEPFRAFVADKLNVNQRTAGFVMQSFFIGIGASLANGLPYLFRQLGVTGNTRSGIPLTVQYSFKIGAVVFLLAVLWTIFTTKEYPPENIEEFERKRRETYGNASGVAKLFKVVAELLREISSAFAHMPKTMKQLAFVQIFTWLGLFCMWMFFGLTTSYHVFSATNATDPRFALGQEWGGNAFAIYSIVCFIIAFLLPKVASATSRKTVHAISLICGGLGLISVYFIHDKWMLLLTMVGVGIAWASILSMPYAILSGALPAARMGVYMGIFNFFIVIPEIVASLFFGRIIRAIFGANSTIAPLYMVIAGGVFMLIAAALVTFVADVADRNVPEEAVLAADRHEPFMVPEGVQPVPSTGLIDEK
ncbi:MAG TPA: MFS transporter [Pyrinomonadaceae bacterium]|jgi:maltose/moltooligosaccharide transporter|nr:MFS transporter [Pyrinomonadaceae bacterium]